MQCVYALTQMQSVTPTWTVLKVLRRDPAPTATHESDWKCFSCAICRYTQDLEEGDRRCRVIGARLRIGWLIEHSIFRWCKELNLHHHACWVMAPMGFSLWKLIWVSVNIALANEVEYRLKTKQFTSFFFIYFTCLFVECTYF